MRAREERRGPVEEMRGTWFRFAEQTKKEMDRRNPNGSAFQAPREFLKMAIYHFVNHLTGQERGYLFSAFRKEVSNPPESIAFSENPYHWAYRAFIEYNDLEPASSSVSRYARQLKYAKLHGVPTQYLVGFIKQCGGHKAIEEKLATGVCEPNWYGEFSLNAVFDGD